MVSSHNRDRARQLDREDPLAFARSEFNIPSKAEIASTRLVDKTGNSHMLFFHSMSVFELTQKNSLRDRASVACRRRNERVPMRKLSRLAAKEDRHTAAAISQHLGYSGCPGAFQTSRGLSSPHMARRRCKSRRVDSPSCRGRQVRSGRHADLDSKSSLLDVGLLPS